MTTENRIEIEKRIEQEMFSYANLIEQFTTLNMQKIKLEEYQRELVNDDDRLKVINKCRRAGFSTSLSNKKVIKAHILSNYTCYFMSYNKQEAMEKIRVAKMAWESMPDKINGKRIKKRAISDNKTSLELLDYDGKTTSRLISFPCRPLRGPGGDLVLDELAFYRNGREIYQASQKIIQDGNLQWDLEIGSTPAGKKGIFYELVTDINKFKQVKRYEIFWWMSSMLCKDVKRAEELAPYMDTEERVYTFGTDTLIMFFETNYLEDFQQEFECAFIDSSYSFLSFEMIRDCMPEGNDELDVFSNLDDFLVNYDKDKHGLIYAGFDVGRRRDASELILLGLKDDKFYCWLSLTWHQKDFEYQLNELRKLLKQGIVVRFCGDETGLGMQLMETLHKEFSYLVEPVGFTAAMKEKMANDLYLLFQNVQLVLPNDKELFRQLHSVRRVVTNSKHARFDVDDNKAHADKFWALALALYSWSGNKNISSMDKFYDRQLEDMGFIKTEKPENPYELKPDDNPNDFLDRVKDFYQGGGM